MIQRERMANARKMRPIERSDIELKDTGELVELERFEQIVGDRDDPSKQHKIETGSFSKDGNRMEYYIGKVNDLTVMFAKRDTPMKVVNMLMPAILQNAGRDGIDCLLLPEAKKMIPLSKRAKSLSARELLRAGK